MLNRLRRAYIPVLTQITVPYVILAMLIAAGGIYLLTQVVVDSVTERFTNQLIDTARLSEEGLVRVEQRMLESQRLLSHVQGIDAAIEDRLRSALSQLALPIAVNAELEAFVFLDDAGNSLLSLNLDEGTRTYEQLTPSDPYRSVGFIQQVLRGEVDEQGDKTSGFVSTALGDYLFVAGPVVNGEGQLVGVAMVGMQTENLVKLLQQETLGHLTFYTLDGVPLTSTLLDSTAIDPQQAALIVARQSEGSYQRSLVSAGETYSEILSPFAVREGENVGLMGVALATDFLVQTGEITRNNTLCLMGFVLILVIGVGSIVAGRITRPIRELKEAAVKISHGDLRVRVAGQRRDEVGVLADSFNTMVENLSKSQQDLLDTYDKTIEGWARALDLRDHETEGHSRRVAELAMRLGKKLKLNAEDMQNLYRGALLHDIGKIAIPDKILLKKGKLDKKQWELMRQHPVYAKLFMEQIDFLKPAMDVPYGHHERWDGKGYPRGLKGEEIPLLARIFTVADVWDALTTDRPYRKAMLFTDALDIMRAESGQVFDPKIVKAFLQILEEKVNEISK